jgi:hypothetical protein
VAFAPQLIEPRSTVERMEQNVPSNQCPSQP